MKQRTSITRTLWPIVLLAILMPILCSAVFAATVGDQVELKATHQAGVPLHQELHGTND